MQGARLKAVLLGMLGILLVSMMMGVAYASPSRNCNHHGEDVCSHNRLDLKLMDQDEGWGDGVVATWTASNMVPGDEFTFDGSFVGLRSNKNSNVDITCIYEVFEEFPQAEADTDPGTNLHPDKMAKNMVITWCIYKNSTWQIDCLTGKLTIISRKGKAPGLCCSHSWRIRDIDRDGRITFYDLKQSTLSNLPLPDKGNTNDARFEVSVEFHQNAGNEFQGDTFNLAMLFRLKPE
jgi:hypothetical protein